MKKRFSEGFLLKNCFVGCFGNRFSAFSKERTAENNAKIEAALKHLNKYLNELKLHFDLTEDDVVKLLARTYGLKKPENTFLKYLNMLKYWN